MKVKSETSIALNKLAEHIREHKNIMTRDTGYYDESQPCNKRTRTCYFRSTIRIHDDLVLTFMEDGKINLKRGKDTITLDEQELNYILQVASQLRDYKSEQRQSEIESIDKRQADLEEQRLLVNGTGS